MSPTAISLVLSLNSHNGRTVELYVYIYHITHFLVGKVLVKYCRHNYSAKSMQRYHITEVCK